MRGRPWTFDEVIRLFELIEEKKTSIEIGKILGRNRRCIGRRVKDYGLSLDYRKMEVRQPKQPETASERLAANTEVPVGLAKLVKECSERRGLTVKQVRSPLRTMELVACRREIAVKARSQGYSFPRIGRALNRDHTSVMHLVRTHPSTTTNKAGDRLALSPYVPSEHDRIAA